MPILKRFRQKRPEGSWVNIPDINDILIDNVLVRRMRPNQLHIFNKFSSNSLMIICEPPGAGKSTTIKFVHGKDLFENPHHKLVIAVPQTIIAKTFRRAELQYPDGQRISWDVGLDLCDSASDERVIRIFPLGAYFF